MNTILLGKVEEQYIKPDRKEVGVGDTVKVHNKIREGEK